MLDLSDHFTDDQQEDECDLSYFANAAHRLSRYAIDFPADEEDAIRACELRHRYNEATRIKGNEPVSDYLY